MCEDISHSHSSICLANKAMHCSLVSCESLRAFSVIMCLEELKKAWWVHSKRSCSLLWCRTCRRLYSWVHRRTCVNVALLEMGILVILSTWVQINQPSFITLFVIVYKHQMDFWVWMDFCITYCFLFQGLMPWLSCF